jgi:hypothetical protein
LHQEVPAAALAGRVERLPERDGVYVAERTLDLDKLDESLRGWIGRKVFASSDGGGVCETRVTELRARAEAIPHFGQQQRWEGIDFSQPDQRAAKPPPDEVTTEVWELGLMGGLQLVGLLRNPCPKGLLATPEFPRAIAMQAGDADADLTDYLRNEVVKLPRGKAIQKAFAESSPKRARQRWIDHASAHYYTFAAVGGVQTAVASTAVGQGCGDVQETLTVVFELDIRGPVPRVVRHRTMEGVWGGTTNIRSGADFDGDGQLELISGPEDFERSFSLWRPTPSGYDRTVLRSVGFFDCPC